MHNVVHSWGYSGRSVKLTARPPSIAEVKNQWSYTSVPRVCLQGVDSYSFTGVQHLQCQ